MKSKKQIDIFVYALIGVGIFEAIYAISQFFRVKPSLVAGTFADSNDFALFMVMIFCIILGSLVSGMQKSRQVSSRVGFRVILQWFIGWFSLERTHARQIVLFFAALIGGVALLVSSSAPGIMALGVAIFLVSILFFTKKQVRKSGFTFLGLSLLLLILGLHSGFKDAESANRPEIKIPPYLYMTKDYPLVGTGWGNSDYLYARYAAQDFESKPESHVFWFKVTSETGIVGGILVISALIFFFVPVTRIWRERRDPQAIGIGAGVMAVLFAFGIKGLFGMSVSSQSNFFTLAAIFAIGYAAVYRQGRGYMESFFYKTRSFDLNTVHQVIVMAVVASVLSVVNLAMGRNFLAEMICPNERVCEFEDVQKAVELSGGNAEYHYWLAQNYMEISHPSEMAPIDREFHGVKGARRREPGGGFMVQGTGRKDEESSKLKAQSSKVETESLKGWNREGFVDKAVGSLLEAVRLNPANAGYWLELGKLYSQRRNDPFKYINRSLPLADRCFDVSVSYAPYDSGILYDAASYWVTRSLLLKTKNDEISTKMEIGTLSQENAVQTFQQVFQRSLSLNPDRWEAAADRVWG
ncbi:O-antigen ligase family protein, partial [Thermodesulfobacteriota bacterium]